MTDKSNYDRMRNQMRSEFIKYDQKKMIEKFNLNHDNNYLYVNFVSRDYRIHRTRGIVEWSDNQFHSVVEADYNESMTIYDVLCYSRDDCKLSGKFCPIHRAKGVPKTIYMKGSIFQKSAAEFQGHLRELKEACSQLGESLPMAGDVAALIQAFPFLPVTFQFWEGDDEFPPSLKFMFDENILEYMHFETVHFMSFHILRRIREGMHLP